MEMKPKLTQPPSTDQTHLVQDRFGRENVVQGFQRDVLRQRDRSKQRKRRKCPTLLFLEQEVAAATTHALGGLVHTLDGRSSAIIQEQRLLPVVVVGLQDVPPAQF